MRYYLTILISLTIFVACPSESNVDSSPKVEEVAGSSHDFSDEPLHVRGGNHE